MGSEKTKSFLEAFKFSSFLFFFVSFLFAAFIFSSLTKCLRGKKKKILRWFKYDRKTIIVKTKKIVSSLFYDFPGKKKMAVLNLTTGKEENKGLFHRLWEIRRSAHSFFFSSVFLFGTPICRGGRQPFLSSSTAIKQ